APLDRLIRYRRRITPPLVGGVFLSPGRPKIKAPPRGAAPARQGQAWGPSLFHPSGYFSYPVFSSSFTNSLTRRRCSGRSAWYWRNGKGGVAGSSASPSRRVG